MPSGTLEVLLVGASGIKDTEIFGKGDPYCILTCGRTQARSSTAEDQGSKPVWNQKFTLGVDESTSEIWIRIYNRNVLEDDELGTCIILLSRVYNSAHKLPTTSFSVLRPSGRQQGEIKLSMTFVPKGMGGPGYGTGAVIQPNLYGPGTPAPYSFPASMQYPNPNPGSNWQPPPPPPSYPPAGPPFGSRPGYGGTNPITYPPPPPTDPYGRPPNQDPYGANTYATTTSGPYGTQPSYGGSKKENGSYGPYGVAPPGPGYCGAGPLACYPPLGDQYGKAPKHDPYGNSSSQPPMGGYGGPQAPPAAIPPAMGYPAQMPHGLKTNGPPPAGYPKVGGYGAQTGGYIPPTNPNDPYGNKLPHGAPGYNVDAAAAGIAALGLAGAAAYGVNEHNKVGKPEKMMGGQFGYGGYGSQGYPPVGYPPPAPAPGYGGPGARGYSQPASYLGGSAHYTPAGYPAVYGTQGNSRGKYELHHEGCHKIKKGKKDKNKNKKGKRK